MAAINGIAAASCRSGQYDWAAGYGSLLTDRIYSKEYIEEDVVRAVPLKRRIIIIIRIAEAHDARCEGDLREVQDSSLALQGR